MDSIENEIYRKVDTELGNPIFLKFDLQLEYPLYGQLNSELDASFMVELRVSINQMIDHG
jgi:hypothetical protein